MTKCEKCVQIAEQFSLKGGVELWHTFINVFVRNNIGGKCVQIMGQVFYERPAHCNKQNVVKFVVELYLKSRPPFYK